VQREGRVREWKESERVRGTHYLQNAEDGKGLETVKEGEGNGHTLTTERRRNKSRQRKKESKPEELTSWKMQMKRRIRT
jgi:hypothetical protein